MYNKITFQIPDITHQTNLTTSSQSGKITDRSFTHHAPVLWNALPKEFRKPAIHFSDAIQFGSTPPLLDLSTSQLHSKLKTYLFHKSFPS